MRIPKGIIKPHIRRTPKNWTYSHATETCWHARLGSWNAVGRSPLEAYLRLMAIIDTTKQEARGLRGASTSTHHQPKEQQ